MNWNQCETWLSLSGVWPTALFSLHHLWWGFDVCFGFSAHNSICFSIVLSYSSQNAVSAMWSLGLKRENGCFLCGNLAQLLLSCCYFGCWDVIMSSILSWSHRFVVCTSFKNLDYVCSCVLLIPLDILVERYPV